MVQVGVSCAELVDRLEAISQGDGWLVTSYSSSSTKYVHVDGFLAEKIEWSSFGITRIILTVCGLYHLPSMLPSSSLQGVYQGEGWLGIGFSDSGRMAGSDSVIGLPDDETALEYDMDNYNQPVAAATQARQSASTGAYIHM